MDYPQEKPSIWQKLYKVLPDIMFVLAIISSFFKLECTLELFAIAIYLKVCSIAEDADAVTNVSIVNLDSSASEETLQKLNDSLEKLNEDNGGAK